MSKGKAGRCYSLTPKGKKTFEVWSKHLEEIEKELLPKDVK
jgi:DNA-binding PadR family transcriptional regulator